MSHTSDSSPSASFETYKFPVSDGEAPAHAVYPFVTGAYRKGGSYIDNVWSLFHLHTEFVNAWTMIIASVGSIMATTYVSTKFLDTEAIPIFVIFTASAVLHLPFTLGYHLFMSMDEHTFNVWRRLDVIAIFNVSVLLTFSLSYFVLPWWGCLLNTAAAALIAATATISVWKTPVDHVIDGSQQSKFVGSIIACYWFPLAFALVRDTCAHMFTLSSASAIGVSMGLIFSGWAYASWWPQKRAPGKYNVWLHSHQMMHIGVMVCHALEFVFIWDNWARSRGCKAPTITDGICAPT